MGVWDTLRRVPTQATAIATGNDGLFVCPARGTRPSPTALDYREPSAAVLKNAFWFSDAAAGQVIACDRQKNHGSGGTSNVLRASGVVETVDEGSPAWRAAMDATQDPK